MPKKISNFFSNIKLQERMLLIYILGGILPFFIADVVMYHSVSSVMIDQAKESELDQLTVMAESLDRSTSVMEEVSKRLYFDEDLEKIALTDYTSYQSFIDDYNAYDTFDEYLSNYYQEISDITIYMYNTTLKANDYFNYADATVKSKNWYINAVNLKGSPYWFYEYDSLNQKNNLCMARMVYTKDQQKVGVLKLTMQNNRSELTLTEHSGNAMLCYDTEAVVHSNFTWDYDDEVLAALIEQEKDSFSEKVHIGKQDYLVSGVRVHPDYSDDVFTYVSLRPYREILVEANLTTIKNLFPIFIGVVFAVFLITIFSRSLNTRMETFRHQMHKAARGDFDIAKSIGGRDEFAELYDDLTNMIADIQHLMDQVVQEQVAKEQLNTRQKEVEFKMLASQINPHFLYNTLETIRMQARINDQPNIEELAKMLAKIMRHNIQVGDKLQPVAEEIKLVQYYLKIQDYRFHDRISYRINMKEDEVEHLMMLPLLIQPYVENSFVHGLESKTSGGLIEIDVEVRNHLWITVTDNGCGMSPEKLDEVIHNLNDFENLDRTHIGICNVNQRIKLQYGEEYGVDIESTEGEGTKVIIKLPKIY